MLGSTMMNFTRCNLITAALGVSFAALLQSSGQANFDARCFAPLMVAKNSGLPPTLVIFANCHRPEIGLKSPRNH